MILKLIGGPLDGQERNYDQGLPTQWLLVDAHNMAQYKRGQPCALNERGEPTEIAYHFTGLTEAAHS